MPPVPQNTDDFRGQRFIQEFDNRVAVGLVIRGQRAFFDMLPGTFPDGLHILNH